MSWLEVDEGYECEQFLICIAVKLTQGCHTHRQFIIIRFIGWSLFSR